MHVEMGMLEKSLGLPFFSQPSKVTWLTETKFLVLHLYKHFAKICTISGGLNPCKKFFVKLG